MFEVGFTEIILILGIALVVLGPEKLPKVAAEIGRWLGRARAMARQLKSQLDEEVIKADRSWSSPQPKKPPPQADAGNEPTKPAAAAAGAGEPSKTSAAETPASDPAAPAEAGKQPETEFKPSP